MSKPEGRDLSASQKEALRSLRVSRVIYPIILGIGVVAYLLYRQFDLAEFNKINWQPAAWFWIFMAVLLLVVRHLAYSARLRTLSGKVFSWRKCIELIFIWEFSSAVSPTSVGGSAVALFVLSQEKLPAAKTTAIVLYTIVLDSLFFVATIPILYWIFGPSIIRPELTSIDSLDGWALTFVGAYIFMALYGAFFFFALFLRPDRGRAFLLWLSTSWLFGRWEGRLKKLGEGFVEASREMWRREFVYHLQGFLYTAVAWSMRFFIITCLIIAIVQGVPGDFFSQLKLYARLETMFVILAFSPTPGGAGFHEFVFGGFLSDYVPVGIAAFVAFIWRLLTYYSYLLAGAIIIPNWLRNVWRRRQDTRQSVQSESA